MSQRNFYSCFIVGIDLGTTNNAVAYFDAEKPKSKLQLFQIPQQGKHGHLEALQMLPSFLYLEKEDEITIGMWAKTQGAQVPTKLIQSAKSWLSNPAANRKENILPFEADPGQKKLSPLEATTHYLTYIRRMWNQEMAKNDPTLELEEQEVILTVPASFDEVARTLTIEAAKLAGYKHVTLLEEPQAAFYSFLMECGQEQFKPSESILVCDVGGGTTDFSLIDVVKGDEGIGLRRMAVGKHLLLGGDNMDAALCYLLEKRLTGELDTKRHLSLLHQTREAKEVLLSSLEKKAYSIFLSGEGSHVVGGGVSFELTTEEIHQTLLDGFFGLVSFDETITKGSGLRKMGLPYETDPSITKHLANFLKKSACKKKPTYLLFNGGSMKPSLFQKRIVESLNLWFENEEPIQILPTASLDLAVARGAAYFGKVRRGEGMRIGGGIPRGYYLGIEIEGEKERQALTLLARGTEEGTRHLSERLFSLVPNQPVAFQLYHSNTRIHDALGQLIPIEEEQLTRLPPIQTLCAYGKRENKEPIPVKLETYLTEIGTLELWLLSQVSDHRWKLEFQLRGEAQEERSFDKRLADETFDNSYLEPAKLEIQETFAIGSQEKLKTLMPTIESILERERQNWSPSILRGLFEPLIEQADKRLLSSNYEQRFWNLAGYFLRPGMGHPLDDHRLKQLWKIILSDFKKPKSDEVQLQQWICFRRIAAGLGKGQQLQLFNDLFPLVYDKKKQRLNIKGKKGGYIYSEKLRALAALELVEVSQKIKLGQALLKRITKGEAEACDYWALGRLGARQLFHGSVANVVPAKTCQGWVEELLNSPAASTQHLPFTLTMLARKTDSREINLATPILEKITPILEGYEELETLLKHERELSLAEQDQFFGDSLPTGLILTNQP